MKMTKLGKSLFWIGLIALILGALFIFISGSSSGPEMKPTVPFLYGTNQMYWMLLGIVGFIVMVIGLVLKLKKR